MNTGALNSFAINGRPLDATVRAVIVGYAYAVAIPIGNAIDATTRFIVDASAYANATITARVLSPIRVSAPASAVADPRPRVLTRSPKLEYAFGDAMVQANAWTRDYVGCALVGLAMAGASVASRARVRLDADAVAGAYAVPQPKALTRSALTGAAQAIGYVHPTSSILLPFDKKAIPENTFMVPAKVGTFFAR